MNTKLSLLSRVGAGVIVAVLAGAEVQAKPVHHRRHAVASAKPSSDALALETQVQVLKDQVAALQAWRDQEAGQQAQADRQVADLQRQLADAQTQSQAARAAVAEQIQTIPGQVKSEIAAEKPKDGKIHYKGVTLTLGGFLAEENIYRSKNELADISSQFAKLPFDNSPLGRTQELRGTARQSRVSFLAEGDINPNTHAAMYGEFDFQAGAQTGNSNESNSYSPRIRHLYGALDWDNVGMTNLHFLAGQTWSLVTMNTKGISPRNELTPPTIDAQYIPGFSWARQPQIRLTADFAEKQIWAAVSLENPQSTYASAATGTTGTSVSGLTVTDNGTPANGFDTANTLSVNHLPDAVAKLAIEPDLGGVRPVHLEVYGLYRDFYDRVNVTTAKNALGLPVGAGDQDVAGGGFGAGLTWTVVPKLVDFETSALIGRGIGRYGSGQLPDSVVGPNGALKPIPEVMGMAGLTLHATPTLDVYAFGGQEREQRVVSMIGTGAYGFGSPTATLAGCDVEGGTCSPDVMLMSQLTAGVWDKIYQGGFGMVRVGVQYSYTELRAFPGATGGSPKTDDNMIFTSFRYYPF
jgi:hypothetical protein